MRKMRWKAKGKTLVCFGFSYVVFVYRQMQALDMKTT